MQAELFLHVLCFWVFVLAGPTLGMVTQLGQQTGLCLHVWPADYGWSSRISPRCYGGERPRKDAMEEQRCVGREQRLVSLESHVLWFSLHTLQWLWVSWFRFNIVYRYSPWVKSLTKDNRPRWRSTWYFIWNDIFCTTEDPINIVYGGFLLLQVQ